VERTADRTVAADGGRPLTIALTSYRSKPHSGARASTCGRCRASWSPSATRWRCSPAAVPRAGPGGRRRGADAHRGAQPGPLPGRDPFRTPHPREIRGPLDLLELALMWTAAFPEPLTVQPAGGPAAAGPPEPPGPGARQPDAGLRAAAPAASGLPRRRHRAPPDHRGPPARPGRRPAAEEDQHLAWYSFLRHAGSGGAAAAGPADRSATTAGPTSPGTSGCRRSG
jgi:hypothetical protein